MPSAKKLRILAATLLAVLSSALAQDAKQSILLTAVLRPTIRLSDEMLFLYFRPDGAGCQWSSSTVGISWNVDRFTRQIQLIALFPSSDAAVEDTKGQKLPASIIEASFGNSPWKRFPETRPHAGSSGLLLASINVSETRRKADQNMEVQFRICAGQGGGFMAGPYHGHVKLHAVIR
jgi:hypothetical protein